MASINPSSGLPVNFGVLIFPGFEILDAISMLDPLNLMSRKQHMNLSVIARTLDPVSTKPQHASLNPANSSFSQTLVPTHTLKDNPDIDVLLVPGGVGMREPLQEEVDYIRRTYPKLKYLLTVCTGSVLTARSGVLDGKKATSNKRAWNWVTSQISTVNWIGHARWVADGNVWTSSGVSAGFDGVLDWIETVYGEDVADEVTKEMEYVRKKNSTDDPFAALYNCTDVPAH